MGYLVNFKRYVNMEKVIKLTGEDAIRITSSGSVIEGFDITDEATTEIKQKAHRDAYQIIPVRSDGTYNTQFAGAMIDDITVRDNIVVAKDSKLQCLFCSDGGITNAKIENNIFQTDSDHFISLSLMSGKIKNNRDENGNLVPIRLFPLRIGGNADGQLNVFILSFSNPDYSYAPIEDIVLDETKDHVYDHRFGEGRKSNSVYLHDFDLDGYIEEAGKRQLTAIEMRSLALKYGTKEGVMLPTTKTKPTPFDIGLSQMGQKELSGGLDNPVIVEYFKATTYGRPDGDEIPWCSAVHCWIHEQAGVAHTRSAAALSWLSWGTPLVKPVKGCTVVFDYGRNGSGHVGFWLSETDTHVSVMGGNQSDSYRVSNYAKSNFVAIHYRAQKKIAASKIGNGALGTGTIGTIGATALGLEQLGIDISQYTGILKGGETVSEATAPTTTAPKKPAQPTITNPITGEESEIYEAVSCDMINCPSAVPDGYIAIPESTINLIIGVCAVLVITAFITYKDRLKKITDLGI